jgi:hypothetical protein
VKTNRRGLARNLIITGFVVIFVGNLIDFVWQVSNGYIWQNWRADVNIFALVLAPLAALGGWWFLSLLTLEEPEQQSLVLKAYLGLAVQALFLSATYLIFLFGIPNFSWTSAIVWGYGVGEPLAAIGFFMMAMSYQSKSAFPDEVIATDL